MIITQLYNQLKNNLTTDSFTAIIIPNWDAVYLAVDADGRPCLFVKTNDRSFDAPLRTANVILQLGQEYSLNITDGTQTQQLFHSLRCESHESNDIETFLMLVNAFLTTNTTSEITGSILSTFFKALARLFSVLPSNDLAGERQGLWGELFMMSRIRGYKFWAPYWHSKPNERFDFSAPGRRVEVKTTVSMERIHHFSHRQIYSSEDEIIVASILLREVTPGLSLRDLITDCRAALLDSPFYLKLEKSVRSAKMHDNSEPGPEFDAEDAERWLAWYRAVDAPHFRTSEPSGVSETRYKVDLSLAPQLNYAMLEEWLSTWPLIMPQSVIV